MITDKQMVICLPAVAGLSRQQLAAIQGTADSSHSASGTAARAPANPSLQHQQQHLQASLLRSLPVVVLADPSPNRPQAGVVLSVAPVLGARPFCDDNVQKWLHVHVRPSVRGLLRIIKVGYELL